MLETPESFLLSKSQILLRFWLGKPSPLKISNPLEILARKASSSQIRESSLEFGQASSSQIADPPPTSWRMADSQQFGYDPKVPIS